MLRSLVRAARVALVAGGVWLALVPAPLAQTRPPPELPSGWVEKSLVRTDREIVAAAHPLATQAGIDILAAGGSAVDAAVAVQMVLNLVEPQSSGIGGGAFLVHWEAARGRVEAFDGRETAPGGVDERWFLDAGGQPLDFVSAAIGGRSVATPGVLRMLELAHREKGRLPWPRLFDAAIRMAEEGFPVSPRLYAALASANPALRSDAVTGPYFFLPDGSARPVGTVIRNPAFAATLRALAAGGADAFYTGAIARDIVEFVRSNPANPGVLSLADLAGYRAKQRAPLCGRYRQRTICGIGMPSSGVATVLMTLAMVERFDVRALGANSVDAVHILAEAYRLAYADRAQYMADSDFVPVPIAGLLDPAYLAARASRIDPARSMGTPAPGRPPGCCEAKVQAPGPQFDPSGTSHLSIVDRDGNAVSMTTTIESAFGSYQMVRGFLLNNQLTDFSFVPEVGGRVVANRVQPGKRPRSSMAPVLVFDAKARLEAVLGSPGGSQIIQYVTKTLVGLIDWDLDMQQAIALPNFGAQTSSTTILERYRGLEGAAEGLRERGHGVSFVDANSGVQGVTPQCAEPRVRSASWAMFRPCSGWAGGADPRREGAVGGR